MSARVTDIDAAMRALELAEIELLRRCDRLRETAEELRRGEIHPMHAANRIEKIANEIAKERK